MVFTPFKRGPGASSRLAHLAVCCRHRCLGRQPKKSGKTLQMGVVTAQASLGLASCPRGHPSSVHSEHSRRRRGANGEARPVTLRCCPLRCSPPASSTDSTAERLGSAGGATRGLCCGHLGRLSGASQRLGRASFTHAATTKLSGPGVESWCEMHVRGGCGHSRSTRRASKLAVGVLSWREPRPLQRSRVQ